MSNLPLEVVEMLGGTIAKVVPITIGLALVFSVATTTVLSGGAYLVRWASAIAGTETELGQRRGQAASPAVEVAVASADDGAVGATGDYFDAREKLVSALEERGEGERKVHHRAAHENLVGVQANC